MWTDTGHMASLTTVVTLHILHVVPLESIQLIILLATLTKIINILFIIIIICGLYSIIWPNESILTRLDVSGSWTHNSNLLKYKGY